MKPIEVWPPVKHQGRPGYSARHYAALAGGQDDPLRIAERIARRSLPAGSDPFAKWEELCSSWDAVIAALESAQHESKAIAQALKQARKAAAKHR